MSQIELKTKKRKQPSQQLVMPEAKDEDVKLGSAEYITDREIDQIIKKGKEKLKLAINLSDIKLTKTKKQIIKELAQSLEAVKYPTNQICDRLTKSLKHLVSDRTVRDALDMKYKNTEQSQVARMQDGGSNHRQEELVAKKEIKDITEEDFKYIKLPKAKQVCKHQTDRASWFEQQVSQLQEQIRDLIKNLFIWNHIIKCVTD